MLVWMRLVLSRFVCFFFFGVRECFCFGVFCIFCLHVVRGGLRAPSQSVVDIVRWAWYFKFACYERVVLGFRFCFLLCLIRLVDMFFLFWLRLDGFSVFSHFVFSCFFLKVFFVILLCLVFENPPPPPHTPRRGPHSCPKSDARGLIPFLKMFVVHARETWRILPGWSTTS